MSWSLYIVLILFFDYNLSLHSTIRQMDAFLYQFGKYWLQGNMRWIGESI